MGLIAFLLVAVIALLCVPTKERATTAGICLGAILCYYVVFPVVSVGLALLYSGGLYALNHPLILLSAMGIGYTVLFGVAFCIDSKANARIAAGDPDGISKRKAYLITEFNYTPERADEAIKRVVSKAVAGGRESGGQIF
jgi:hypothetical protein